MNDTSRNTRVTDNQTPIRKIKYSVTIENFEMGDLNFAAISKEDVKASKIFCLACQSSEISFRSSTQRRSGASQHILTFQLRSRINSAHQRSFEQ